MFACLRFVSKITAHMDANDVQLLDIYRMIGNDTFHHQFLWKSIDRSENGAKFYNWLPVECDSHTHTIHLMCYKCYTLPECLDTLYAWKDKSSNDQMAKMCWNIWKCKHLRWTHSHTHTNHTRRRFFRGDNIWYFLGHSSQIITNNKSINSFIVTSSQL